MMNKLHKTVIKITFISKTSKQYSSI